MRKKMVVLLLMTVMATSGCNSKETDPSSAIASETQLEGEQSTN